MSKNWPAWYYGPEGQSSIFETASEVPEGWQDSPAAFAKQEEEAPQGRQPADAVEDNSFYDAMSEDELRAHLTMKNISFHPKAKRDKLVGLLRTARPDVGTPEA